MTSRFLAPMLCAAAIAFACVPRSRTSEASAHNAPPRPRAEGMALSSSLDVVVSNGVQMTLHVTNASSRHVEINFPSGQTHDFVILDDAGREVWRWSQDRMFTQALQNKLLDSRETLSYSETWDAAGRHGHFTAVGQLNSTSHPIEQRIEFNLP